MRLNSVDEHEYEPLEHKKKYYYFHLKVNVNAKKEGRAFILAVVLLSWRRCVFTNMVTVPSHA